MTRHPALPLLAAGLALAQPLAAGESPAFPGASWESHTPEEAAALGWSAEALAEAEAYARGIDTAAVVIVAGGKILAQWGETGRKFNCHSIRKSLLSALYGIQVEEGLIDPEASLGELGIDDNEPSLTETEKRATVRDLLWSRSGVYHPALYETARMKAARPERHSHEPGAFWYYNNWDFNALGTIYEEAVGGSLFEDFESLVARPLGMEDYEASDGSYVTGEDSLHRAYPFRMSARDLARFGLLYLRGGAWNGEQVVPAGWVRESLEARSDAGSRGGYGYCWWVEKDGRHLPGLTLPAGSFTARGARGHYVLVVPPLDLVVVHRVDTDDRERRVEAEEFGELARLLLAAWTPPPGSVSAPASLDALMPVLMARHRVPGVSVAAIENHSLAWEFHAGLRQAGGEEPVDAGTVFEAASMTKPLAAYAALQLVERGELDLDRPLASYLPHPYLEDEPEHKKITARMALTHTGGFPNWRRGRPLKVGHEPGTAYRYSGEGYLFLQRALEAITGSDYEDHVRQALLQPLGMDSSSHVWSGDIAALAASGHDAEGRPCEERRLYRRANAAYTLYTTPRDYAAFLLEMMRPDREARHSLSAETLRKMLEPASPPTGRESLVRGGSDHGGEVRHALGWAVEPVASGHRYRHSGSNSTGFRCHCEFDPAAGRGIVIMTNAVGGAALWRELLALVGEP